MKNFRMCAVIIAVLMAVSFASQTWALDQSQEEEYRKARRLLTESKTKKAMSIFTDLAKDNSSSFKIRLGIIDTNIEEARILKSGKKDGWKNKIYAAFGDLKSIFRANATSPEIYLSFAKCYWVNNRFLKANKSIKKALYYKPGYTEAFILRGDMFSRKAEYLRINPDDSDSEYEKRQAVRTAKLSYEKALSGNDIDTYTQALVNYKLGNFLTKNGYKTKGIEYLDKAVELSPDSFWGKKSRERLNELK